VKRAGPVMPVGIVTIVVALGFVHSRLAAPQYSFGDSRLLWTAGYAATLTLAAYSLGLPDVFDRVRQVAAAAIVSVVTGAVVISIAQLVLGMAVLPRFVVLGAMPSVAVWLAACSLAVRRDRRRALSRDQVVLVGCGEDMDAVPLALAESPERPAEIVAVLDVVDARGMPGRTTPLVEATQGAGGTVVVLDRAAQADQAVVEQVASLHAQGVRVRTLSLFYEYWLGRLPVGELERISLMFDIGEIHRARFARRKRLIDVGAALLFLPVLFLAIPVVALGNLVGNRGSLFYRQDRVGKNGVVFEIRKFRSMRDAAGEASDWTECDDARITAFGHLLRRSHVDELPQLINVLKGELSMVGPRPEQPHYVEQLTEKLPFYQLRHLVQPGLTGWAQVNQGYASSTSDALEKLQYEFWYMRHQRLAVDLRILVRTVRSVVGGDGR